MSRARNIKPKFFRNEDLAEIEPLGRLLFAGLWCEADREGRLEDRPKRIKAAILPYDNCDIDALLASLSDRGFILRYQSNGSRYLQIVNFSKHQNPHVREVASVIPAPDGHRASTVQSDDDDEQEPGASTVLPEIDDEEKPGASPVQSTVQAPDKTGTRPEPARLDSLIPRKEEKICGSDDPPRPPNPETRVPYQAIVEIYNRTMTGLPKVREVSEKRKTLMRRWWLASKSRQDLEFVRSYFEECAEDKFLNGTGPYTNGHQSWMPTFEFLMDKDRATVVFEKAMHRLERAERVQ